MEELAKLAGVSKSTVSRALADSDLINQETRNRIKSLAIEHGFRKNIRASNFRQKNVLTIGVLLPSTGLDNWLASNPFILEMLGCIADQLELHGHELLLAKHSNTEPSWISDFVQNRAVDGIIVLGQSTYHDILNQMAENYRNMVVWGAHIPDQKYISVGSNNYLGGQIVAEHFISKSRKRMAFIGNINRPETKQRFDGYKDTLLKAGLAEPLLIDCPEGKQINTRELISDFLSEGNEFDGLFASNDMLLISCIQSLRERGLSIPKDVSVVGYDDIALAQFTSPSLSSIHQDRALASKLLVEKLLLLMEGKEVESSIIPTVLSDRESS